MTRLTNDLRDSIFNKIMKDLPSRNYMEEIMALVQEIVVDHLPKEALILYNDEKLRPYLGECDVEVRKGNVSIPLWRSRVSCKVIGLIAPLRIRMDDYENEGRLEDGSLYKNLVTKLHESGLVDGYFTQEDLRENVRKRLKSNLKAATTIKRLYEVLEPELHGFIPRVDKGDPMLPATVSPVVDDLRKLGAQLPEVPKAEPSEEAVTS